MKKHIVRAPQTDRYGFTVPTKLSELEDDQPAPYFVGQAVSSALASPTSGPDPFPLSGLTTYENRGFEDPVGSDVQLVIPETGLYLFSATFWWLSTIKSGGGVGRLTTPGTFQLETLANGLRGFIDGSYLYDNKSGPLTTDPGDIPVYVTQQTVAPATVGDAVTFSAEAVSIAIDVQAVVYFSIVRIA